MYNIICGNKGVVRFESENDFGSYLMLFDSVVIPNLQYGWNDLFLEKATYEGIPRTFALLGVIIFGFIIDCLLRVVIVRCARLYNDESSFFDFRYAD